MSIRWYVAGSILLLMIWGCHGNSGSLSQTNVPAATNPTVLQPSDANLNSSPPDDATILANKTSQYAQSVGPLLAQGLNHSSSQPSVVQWVKPDQPPAGLPGVANTSTPLDESPGTEAHKRIRRPMLRPKPAIDDPIILPESADHIAEVTAQTKPTVSTDDLETKLAKQAHDYPRDLAAQIDYQLLRFVRDEPTPDMQVASGMSNEDRQILLALLDGLNNLRSTARSDGDAMLGEKIQPLLEMADRLRSQTELAVPTVALCTRVDSFGVYTPLASTRLPAGQVNRAVVYCEVANFHCTLNDKKLWETRLKQEMTLYTDTGAAIWPDHSNSCEYVDLSHNYRHDFFLARLMELPATLSTGRYLLKISLTDELSNRVAEATTPIEIVAQ